MSAVDVTMICKEFAKQILYCKNSEKLNYDLLKKSFEAIRNKSSLFECNSYTLFSSAYIRITKTQFLLKVCPARS